LLNSLLSGRAEQAVMAIENSIAGPIIPNYALIDKHNLHIMGSITCSSSKFDGTKGQTIEDIVEVHSHPMALLQCMDFFKSIQK
jgi:prephenate dehydratase